MKPNLIDRSPTSRVRLDLKDLRILFELDFNARSSNSVIARKIGLSKQTVDYKIKNMVRDGVILGFFPVIDNQRLGYVYGRLFIETQNVTEAEMKKIISELKQNKKVNWLLSGEGKYDLFIGTWCRNLREFKSFSREILSKYGIHIKDIVETIGIELVHIKPRFLTGAKSTEKIVTGESNSVVDIDDLDRKVLAAISNNARRSLVDISKELKISPKVLAYRLKRLEEKNVIVGYRVNINYDLLGYTYHKTWFELSSVTKEDMMRFRAFFETNQRVIYIVDAIEPGNFDVEFMTASQKEYFSFMREIRFNFSKIIRGHDSVIFTDVHKVTFLPYDLL